MSNELTFYERQKLESWLRSRLSLREIGNILGRTHSILSREIRRNGDSRQKYRADTAQRLFEKRKHAKHQGKIEKNPQLKNYIVANLNNDWSPDAIAGRLKEVSAQETDGVTISRESIYEYIYNKAEKYEKLFLLLPQRRKRRRKRGGRKPRNLPIPRGNSIHNRPDIINERKRFGDWESDVMEFKRTRTKGAVSVQTERKSRLVRLYKMNKKKSPDDKLTTLIKCVESLPPELSSSYTFDNGSENRYHLVLKELFNIETYLCDPFASWQKGAVENTNKLNRRYLPRDTDLDSLTDYDIYLIQERLNNRPRKCLNYQTPNEVINNYLQSGAPKP
ncbi:MAG: IS30 family transposase [Patescibacteria group bacterium]